MHSIPYDSIYYSSATSIPPDQAGKFDTRFQMFHLRRPDVLPVGDLGVRKGMMKVYKLSKLPGRQEMERIADEWRPYRSVGSFYMWRSQEPVIR